ncbi:MAG: methyltransferase domain-containing protein [Planctomycetota bacterium]
MTPYDQNPRVKYPLLRKVTKRVLYTGGARWCSVCDRSARKFMSFGLVPRPDARCPWCNALERHRLTVTFLRERTNLFDGAPKRVLHIAPEMQIERILREAVGDGYLSGDLNEELAMEKMDITDIQHADNSFDVVYCSHVLEHVPDDRKAMREFSRVLRPDGWAVLNVPITADKTFEDPTIEDPKERERLFGQHDHVRRYGPDYVDRLTEAGFDVEVIRPSEVAPAEQLARFGLAGVGAGEVFYCRKQTG